MIDALDKAERRELSKAGAFVRRSARSSIRKRKRPSAAGKPPSSHTGEYRRSILFGYESKRRSVVIGPSATFGGAEVPSLLEFGGQGPAVKEDRWITPSGPARRGVGGKFVSNDRVLLKKGSRQTYKPRPHMLPALEKEAPNFPKLFRNSVRS